MEKTVSSIGRRYERNCVKWARICAFWCVISMRETGYQGLKVLRDSFLFSLAIEIIQYLLAIGQRI